MLVLYVDKSPANYDEEMKYVPEDWESISSKGLYFVEECATVIGVAPQSFVTLIRLVDWEDGVGFGEEGGTFISRDGCL